jgi:hypothetical protein
VCALRLHRALEAEHLQRGAEGTEAGEAAHEAAALPQVEQLHLGARGAKHAYVAGEGAAPDRAQLAQVRLSGSAGREWGSRPGWRRRGWVSEWTDGRRKGERNGEK